MSTGRAAVLGGRVAVSPRTAGLAAGDALAILAFVLAGEVSHYSTAFVLANPGYVLGTYAPFLLGWAVVAPLAGLYDGRRGEGLAGARRSALRGGGAWVLAALIGQGLRATALFDGGAAPTFVLVSLVVGGVLVAGWRAVAAFL